MNFKRVRKGYDPVQVEAFIKSREEQNNSIIENQQKIIDAQADEIKQLRQGKETATVGGAMLMDESRRAAVLKKCDIFSRTVDLFEKLVKSRLTEKEAENLQGMGRSNILHAATRSALPRTPRRRTRQAAWTRTVKAKRTENTCWSLKKS